MNVCFQLQLCTLYIMFKEKIYQKLCFESIFLLHDIYAGDIKLTLFSVKFYFCIRFLQVTNSLVKIYEGNPIISLIIHTLFWSGENV